MKRIAGVRDARRWCICLAVTLALVMPPARGHVGAQTFNPTTTDELVAAIGAAATQTGVHTINLVAGQVYTARVSNNGDPGTGHVNAFPVITRDTDLTINGNGATIARDRASGTPAFRLFTVYGGGTLRLRDLTLRGGLIRGAAGGSVAAGGQGESGGDGSGGAIFNNGALDLRGVTLTENAAIGGAGGMGGSPDGGGSVGAGGLGGTARGGALYTSNGTTVTLVNSTLAGNTATGGIGGNGGGSGGSQGRAGNGGPAFGGSLYSEGMVTIVNATIARNSAATGNNGQGTGSIGTLTSSGGGIALGGGSGSTTATLTNTLLAANTAQSVVMGASNCGGAYPVTDGGDNLEPSPATTCGFRVAPQTGDPLLATGLQDNGGPTPTLAIPPNSPAVGNGNATVCAERAGNAAVRGVDQRGFPRAAAACAIGAFEPQPAPAITGISPASGTTEGAARVRISGSGFMAGVSVSLGPTILALASATATTLTLAMPPRAPGPVTVRVTNPDGQSATVTYTYGTVGVLPPRAPTASPQSGAGALPVSRPGTSPSGSPVPLPPRR